MSMAMRLGSFIRLTNFYTAYFQLVLSTVDRHEDVSLWLTSSCSLVRGRDNYENGKHINGCKRQDEANQGTG